MLDRASSDKSSVLGGISSGRLSSSSSSSQFPIGSYVEVGTHTWSDWAATFGYGTDVASSSGSVVGIGMGSGSVVGVNTFSSGGLRLLSCRG